MYVDDNSSKNGDVIYNPFSSITGSSYNIYNNCNTDSGNGLKNMFTMVNDSGRNNNIYNNNNNKIGMIMINL